MHTLRISEFRANMSTILDLVERGETVRITRRGKPVAELVPVWQLGVVKELPSWKRPFEPVTLPPGVSLSQAVLDERE